MHFGVIAALHDEGATADVMFPAGTIFAGELKIGSPMSFGDGKLETMSEQNVLKRRSEDGADHARDCRVDKIEVVLE